MAAIAIPRFSRFTDTAKEQADKVSATTIKNAFALERANNKFDNTAEVVVTITNPEDGTTEIAADHITVAPDDAGLTDAVADSIVITAVEDLILQSKRDIKITIGADDGSITAELIN